jgi:hypothetical protein
MQMRGLLNSLISGWNFRTFADCNLTCGRRFLLSTSHLAHGLHRLPLILDGSLISSLTSHSSWHAYLCDIFLCLTHAPRRQYVYSTCLGFAVQPACTNGVFITTHEAICCCQKSLNTESVAHLQGIMRMY